MTALHLSESTEMYLKSLIELSSQEMVAIGRLAERLGVTPVSANEMVRRLVEQGLLKHTPYKGVTLTDTGRAVACNVLRRQRLWECFLYDHLKIEWSKTYELACSLEHATAPEVTEALAAFLGHPKTCPRGNPIPDANGAFTPLSAMPLSALAVGQDAQILAVSATQTEVLAYLEEHHLLPGQQVSVLRAAPLQGPLTVRIHGAEKKEIALGLTLAEFVLVKPIPHS